jgi:hypothetical protein
MTFVNVCANKVTFRANDSPKQKVFPFEEGDPN